MNPLVAWVKAREELRKNRELGLPPPWTADPILAAYRFCQAYRELDKVTRWIATHWRTPFKDDPDLWVAMTVARHVNHIETMGQLGYPVPWNGAKFVKLMQRRKGQGLTSYNGAYMIRAGRSADKASYLAEAVFKPLWKARKQLRPVVGDTLDGFHQRLLAQFGLGSFLAAQIVADMKYVEPLKSASDWWEFAASGPGSRRGLNRLLGREVDAPWKEQDWREALAKVRVEIKPQFEELGLEWSHAQDHQNNLCEFSKYEKARLGEGRPKQRYRVSVL